MKKVLIVLLIMGVCSFSIGSWWSSSEITKRQPYGLLPDKSDANEDFWTIPTTQIDCSVPIDLAECSNIVFDRIFTTTGVLSVHLVYQESIDRTNWVSVDSTDYISTASSYGLWKPYRKYNTRYSRLKVEGDASNTLTATGTINYYLEIK